MGEICKLIMEIKQDKEKFNILVTRFEPLINKQVRLLYRDDKEDIHSEFVMAIWEAISKIEYFNNDGQAVTYISNAIRNKYFELYRASRKVHDNETELDDEWEQADETEHSYEDILIKDSLTQIYNRLEGRKKRIFDMVFFKGLTDIEVASKLNISRQYVHRVKKNLCNEIKAELID